MRRWLAIFILAGLSLGLGACATETTASGQPRESSIPWNRPQSWEGAGSYGSAINEGR